MLGAIALALYTKEPGGAVLNNTAIFFTSDNGFYLGEHRLHSKILAYEEGLRVPLYVWAPGTTQPRIVSDLVLNTDLAPTIAELAGYYGKRRWSIPDSFLQGGNPSVWRKRFLVEHWTGLSQGDGYPTFFGIRASDSHKLYVEYNTGEREYYNNLDQNPYQETNAYSSCGATCTVLAALLSSLKTCAGSTCQTLENP